MGDTDRRLEKKRKGEKGMFLPLSTMGSLYSSNCSFSVTLALNRHASLPKLHVRELFNF